MNCIPDFRSKEQAFNSMKREHDGLLLERNNLESELKESQEQIRKFESDLHRSRREDLASRKTADTADLLQGKLDQLTKINNILNDRLAEKERSIRQLEDRLSTQEQDMKSAMNEVEAQRAKLKKREGLISQALKRLEVSICIIYYYHFYSKSITCEASVLPSQTVHPLMHPETLLPQPWIQRHLLLQQKHVVRWWMKG